MPSEPVYDTLDVLSAITVRGPDADGLLWVSFQTDEGFGAFSLQADAAAGRAVLRWSELQSAALAKAAIERAQPRTDKKE
jgi:hypothetical protein